MKVLSVVIISALFALTNVSFAVEKDDQQQQQTQVQKQNKQQQKIQKKCDPVEDPLCF